MPNPPRISPPPRRRKSPLAGAYFTPADLAGAALVSTLASISADLVDARASPPFFQLRNSRTLLRRVEILAALFAALSDSPATFPSAAVTCLKEFYILIHRARALLDHCAHPCRLHLLLQNPLLSNHFHDLGQEIATLLDVVPLAALALPDDVEELVELLRRQVSRSPLHIDPADERLRLEIFSFLNDFKSGRRPDPVSLRSAFVDRLGFRTAGDLRAEIELLEDQIYSPEEDADPCLLGGVVALARYARFLIFEFEDEDVLADGDGDGDVLRTKRFLSFGSDDGSLTVPKDFCCPISLDLMRDPVMAATGQTYDRPSITQWMDEGRITCPNSGQALAHKRLVPNLALRSLISNWCAANGVAYVPPEDGMDAPGELMAIASAGKATIEANRATAEILVLELRIGSEESKAVAARELRLLAKTGKENRTCIAEAGAIPLLRGLLSSTNAVAQENSVTAILNLSIHDKNKVLVMEEDGCLSSIVDVLQNGWTMEARENAAAALFSLSAVHDYKKRIADESGAVEALVGMLKCGRPRGKKDAVTALFNISTHAECCGRMVESGAVSALVNALEMEGVAEDAAGALALLVRRPVVAEAIAREESVVVGLVGLIRRGSPRGKENGVAALHELCRSGGVALTKRVARMPSLEGLIQALLFTGTKRARRKAASLARMCQRCEAAGGVSFSGGWGMGYALARSTSVRRDSSFVGGDVPVSVSVAISVPVL